MTAKMAFDNFGRGLIPARLLTSLIFSNVNKLNFCAVLISKLAAIGISPLGILRACVKHTEYRFLVSNIQDYLGAAVDLIARAGELTRHGIALSVDNRVQPQFLDYALRSA